MYTWGGHVVCCLACSLFLDPLDFMLIFRLLELVHICITHHSDPAPPSAPPPGSPSDSSVPVVSVVGSSVSIHLSTRYPGTSARGQFNFSLIFSAASTANRQSLQPTEVSVAAVNYGRSEESMAATFVVQGVS